ncbi:MAG TPA: MarR family transcriptional regulator [Steroidobacteraceae bacterium]|jgi:DNA-binding MarR family transcriptional regulator
MKKKKRPEPHPELGPLEAMWKLGGPGYLPLRLLLVGKLIDLSINRLLQAHSVLSVAEWRVVAQLAVLGVATVRDMARQACVDPAEVSRAVASLRRRGFADRQPNPLDRRSPRFALTAAGRANFEKFRPEWIRLQKALVAPFSQDEMLTTEHTIALFARACLDFLEQGAAGALPPAPGRQGTAGGCHDSSQPVTEAPQLRHGRRAPLS